MPQVPQLEALPATARSKWPAYNASLKQRGNITVWFSDDVADAWNAAKEDRLGRPRTYSDLAIEVALTVRAVYHLALRQAEGFLQSIARIMGLAIATPDYTAVSRRCRTVRLCAISRE